MADDARRLLGGHDLGALQELVAPHVVSVGVRVHDHPDRHPHAALDLVEHTSRQPGIPQRVDEHRLAVAHHQPGVRLAPFAVRLQPGENPRRRLVQASFEARRLAKQRPLHRSDAIRAPTQLVTPASFRSSRRSVSRSSSSSGARISSTVAVAIPRARSSFRSPAGLR